MLPCALLPYPSSLPPALGLTPPMGLGLDDLTDAPGAHAVLGRQLHLVPGATLEAVQPEGPLARADEHILPLLAVVHRVLQHEACPGGLPGSGRAGWGLGYPNRHHGAGRRRGQGVLWPLGWGGCKFDTKRKGPWVSCRALSCQRLC